MKYDKDLIQRLEHHFASIPNLNSSTIKNYSTCIARIAQILGGDPFASDFLTDKMDVLEAYLNTTPINSQKALLSALLKLAKSDGIYYPTQIVLQIQLQFEKTSDAIRKEREQQVASFNQSINWCSLAELKNVINTYERELKKEGLLKSNVSGELPKALKQKMQKWIIGMLYIGSPENPPVRLDYRNMKITYEKSPPDTDHNWLVVNSRNKKHFVFNSYKTNDTYGQKIIPVGKKLNSALNSWLRFHNSDWLLGDAEISQPLMNKRIVQAFAPSGKTISCSMLRHIFISETFPADQSERSALAELMMHSVKMQTEYSLKQ